MDKAGSPSPYAKLRVLDFGHTVMGPTAGLILADLGAEVIRVEPVDGDPTRSLKGFGTGYFPFYNRNKKSVAVNLKTEAGLKIASDLIGRADVLIENFGPGTMERLGLGYDELADRFPKLIYLSLKGFLPGPYENRVALDEIVQMMSGLAYMTGPPGQPLRAGASVIDVMGGVMGVVGVQTALAQRALTGQGQRVTSALFESAMFLMGQHLAYAALSDHPVPPMPARVSAWAIYDQFTTSDDIRIFLGLTSDRHWKAFCEVFDQPELAAREDLVTNNLRIEARDTLKPMVANILAGMTHDDIAEKAAKAKLPFARIAKPEDLFDDPHLNATGQLLPTQLPGGIETKLPGLPIMMDEQRAGLESGPPAFGSDTSNVLAELGYDSEQIAVLVDKGVIAVAEDATSTARGDDDV